MDEIAILFEEKYDFQFRINLENVETGLDTIHKKTKIHELIKIFNNNGVGWSAQYNKYDQDYVSITVEHGSTVVFELETGCIWRIVFKQAA